jgi:hypothetical protein
MATQTGGYPSLETVMQVARLYLNDWQPGLTSTPGEGQITTDNTTASPQTLFALNSAIREVYRELRNVGDPTLIRDNVQANLPANSVTGPNVQTYLGFSGYYDGGTLQPSPTLPSDMIYPMELWEQQTGSNLPFVPMRQPQGGLQSVIQQATCLGQWEWRGGGTTGSTIGTAGGDSIWFVGSISLITIRMRYLAALTQFSAISGSSAFASTFIPIMDCEEAVGTKVAFKVARALSGLTPAVTDLKTDAAEAMFQLRNAIARRGQTIQYHRIPYGHDTHGTFSSSNSNTI